MEWKIVSVESIKCETGTAWDNWCLEPLMIVWTVDDKTTEKVHFFRVQTTKSIVCSWNEWMVFQSHTCDDWEQRREKTAVCAHIKTPINGEANRIDLLLKETQATSNEKNRWKKAGSSVSWKCVIRSSEDLLDTNDDKEGFFFFHSVLQLFALFRLNSNDTQILHTKLLFHYPVFRFAYCFLLKSDKKPTAVVSASAAHGIRQLLWQPTFSVDTKWKMSTHSMRHREHRRCLGDVNFHANIFQKHRTKWHFSSLTWVNANTSHLFAYANTLTK